MGAKTTQTRDDYPDKLQAFLSVACAFHRTGDAPPIETRLTYFGWRLGLFLYGCGDGASGTKATAGKGRRSIRDEQAKEANPHLEPRKIR